MLHFKNLKTIDPLKVFLDNYTGPFSVHRQALKFFSAKTRINFDKGNFTVKTVQTSAELEEVLRLRYEIFHREFRNKKFPFGLDIDRFDHIADHLVIVDRRINKIVGTYRLICSNYSPTFYSQSEFDLGDLMTRPGTKLELSRACIQKDYRTGGVMNLLWRGISQYLQQIEAQYLFGCASVKTTDSLEAARVYKYLRDNSLLSTEMAFGPTAEFVAPQFDAKLADLDARNESMSSETAKHVLPPLFNSYLKAGAKVCSRPAFDAEFRCMDFLTVLRVADLTRAYERKYVS